MQRVAAQNEISLMSEGCDFLFIRILRQKWNELGGGTLFMELYRLFSRSRQHSFMASVFFTITPMP